MMEGSDADPMTDTEERIEEIRERLIENIHAVSTYCEFSADAVPEHCDGACRRIVDDHVLPVLESELATARDRERELRAALERIAMHPRTHDRNVCNEAPGSCMEEAEKVARTALSEEKVDG